MDALRMVCTTFFAGERSAAHSKDYRRVGQASDALWLCLTTAIILHAFGGKLQSKALMPEFVLVFAVLSLALGGYWALVVFPRQRAFQHKQKFARGLHVGDEVVTYGGIVGKIIDIDAAAGVSQLEIAEGVRIKLLTAALQQVYDAGAIAENAARGLKDSGGAARTEESEPR